MPRLFAKAREPFSSYSHFIGAVLSAVGLLAMVVHMERFGASVRTAVSVLVFCLSLIGLYTASSVYHFSCRAEGIIRRLKKLADCGLLHAGRAAVHAVAEVGIFHAGDLGGGVVWDCGQAAVD